MRYVRLRDRMILKKNIIKFLIGILVVAGAGYYFIKEFYANYDSISQFELNIHWIYLLASQVLLMAVALGGTYFWQLFLKIITGHRISFKESLSIVNTSQLTKYLPGKIWSYAFQMLLLSRYGISKTVVLYTNLFLVASSLMASTLLGLLYFAISSPAGDHFWLSVFLVFLFIYLGFIIFNQRCLKALIVVFGKVFKRNIHYTPVEIKWIVLFQILYLTANALFGLTGYLLAAGLGFSVSSHDIFAIAAFLIIADSVGFIVLIAPGGLGVREGVMFALLAALGDKNMALILPVGTRLMSMVSDLLLGGAGFILLKKLYSARANPESEEK